MASRRHSFLHVLARLRWWILVAVVAVALVRMGVVVLYVPRRWPRELKDALGDAYQ